MRLIVNDFDTTKIFQLQKQVCSNLSLEGADFGLISLSFIWQVWIWMYVIIVIINTLNYQTEKQQYMTDFIFFFFCLADCILFFKKKVVYFLTSTTNLFFILTLVPSLHLVWINFILLFLNQRCYQIVYFVLLWSVHLVLLVHLVRVVNLDL